MKLFLVTGRRNRVRRTFRVSVPRQGPSGAGGARGGRAENVFATALCAPLATHRKINICEPSITVYGILSSARLFLFPGRGRAGSRRPYNRRNFLGKNFSPPRVAKKPPVRVQPSFFRPCFIFPRIFVRASSRYDVPLTRIVNSLISPKFPEDHRAPAHIPRVSAPRCPLAGIKLSASPRRAPAGTSLRRLASERSDFCSFRRCLCSALRLIGRRNKSRRSASRAGHSECAANFRRGQYRTSGAETGPSHLIHLRYALAFGLDKNKKSMEHRLPLRVPRPHANLPSPPRSSTRESPFGSRGARRGSRWNDFAGASRK